MAEEFITEKRRALPGYQIDRAPDIVIHEIKEALRDVEDSIQAQEGVYTGGYTVTVVVERRWKKRRG